MCGIVAGISNKNVLPILIDGLERLEYRGYDSAGIAILNDKIERIRSIGRVASLKDKAKKNKLKGSLGIGHTRWATHGGVTEDNAHPHVSNNQIAVVHNGIIENHEEQCIRLKKLGYKFESETDTEVIAHLIHYYYQSKQNLLKATQLATKDLLGAYAIAVISVDNNNELICARLGCPLIIGQGKSEYFIASDITALLGVTRKIIYLEDGDLAKISKTSLDIFSSKLKKVNRKINHSKVKISSMDLGPHDHFMQKEIYEQPRALGDTIEAVIDNNKFDSSIFGDKAKNIFKNIDSVLILAAGTSHYAGLTAKYWFEDIAQIPTTIEISSEYRYRKSVPNKNQLIITISQSGETLDTIEALKHAKKIGHKKTLAICNVQESAIARASNLVFYTRAGIEIGVASTKAFTTQLVSLFILTVTLAKNKKLINKKIEKKYLEDLRCLVGGIQSALNLEPQIKQWAKHFSNKEHALFLGRGIHYPIALEGALKLKEISYVHAEAYPAGELKHGPIALVDDNMPVIAIAPNDELLGKLKSNLKEVKSRGSQMIVFEDKNSKIEPVDGMKVIPITSNLGRITAPIIFTIPLQLLSYNVALFKGTDVDKPRNLAKSVTVE
jgi:glucosamine--fructose-6-phosphate aminotransferase (isomerizing)